MLQLRFGLRGKARQTAITSVFPFSIGNSSGSQLCIQGDGVWERHAVIELDPATGKYCCSAVGAALLLVNGESTRRVDLRMGDLLQLGSCNIEVSLAPAHQYRLKSIEFSVWLLLALVMLSEIVLICLLH